MRSSRAYTLISVHVLTCVVTQSTLVFSTLVTGVGRCRLSYSTKGLCAANETVLRRSSRETERRAEGPRRQRGLRVLLRQRTSRE